MRQLLSLATQQHYHLWVLCMEILNATFYKLLENRPPVGVAHGNIECYILQVA